MQNISNQLPEKFIERLRTYIPKDKFESVIASFSHERATTFRANTLKISADQLEKDLVALGFVIERVDWYPDAFILQNTSKEELMQTTLYKDGFFYIQNLSSMIPVLLLNPQPQQLILDMAASPGSKTTQMASYMHNTGTIIANDKSPKRLFKLIANLKSQGVTNTKTSAMPGEFLWKKFPEYFDGALVDAPCSMEGRIKIDEPDSYKDWSPRKTKELANLQKWLLRSAISCTKVGGTIVYSTCAMDPKENEDVVAWALKKMPEIIQLNSTRRIYPDDSMEGFFVAKFTKLLPSYAMLEE